MRLSIYAAGLALSFCGCSPAPYRLGPDSRADFAALTAALTEGREYSVEVYDRGSEVAVLAPHGGDLERGTSRLAVSLHGQAERGGWICVGGANAEAGRLVSEALEEAGFRTQFPCRRLPGRSPKNIANRAAAGGVQLEVSLSLLLELDKGGADLSKFTLAVREALSAALKDIKEAPR